MKQSTLLPALLLTTSFFLACSSSETKSAATDSLKTCYIAIDGQDTATLNMRTLNKKVAGELYFKYKNKEDQHGRIQGRISGDTLLVNFFLRNGTAKPVYTNPLALLKRNDTLKLGIAEMETQFGRTYFIPGRAIDYDGSRFQFIEVECGL